MDPFSDSEIVKWEIRGIVMEYRELKKLWEKEEKDTFEGWDFSHLENRWEEEDLPWIIT